MSEGTVVEGITHFATFSSENVANRRIRSKKCAGTTNNRWKKCDETMKSRWKNAPNAPKLLLFSLLGKTPGFCYSAAFPYIAMKHQYFEDFEKNAVLNFEEIEKNRIKNFEETGIYSIFAMLE